MTDGVDRMDDIESRLKELENSSEGWKVSDWVKFVAVVVGLIAGGLGLFDRLYLRPLFDNSEQRSAARDKMAQVEALNEQIYVMRVEGKDRQIGALEEAMRGRRERLAEDLHAFWQKDPDFFVPAEKQTLANELLMQGRTDRSMAIAKDLEDEVFGLIKKADLALFRARALTAEGPAFDLEAGRQAIRDAITISDGLAREEQRREMLVKIGGYRLFFETYYKSDCELAGKVAEAVNHYALPADAPVQISESDRLAQQYLDLHEARCN